MQATANWGPRMGAEQTALFNALALKPKRSGCFCK
jgi:hypothetical protein